MTTYGARCPKNKKYCNCVASKNGMIDDSCVRQEQVAYNRNDRICHGFSRLISFAASIGSPSAFLLTPPPAVPTELADPSLRCPRDVLSLSAACKVPADGFVSALLTSIVGTFELAASLIA